LAPTIVVTDRLGLRSLFEHCGGDPLGTFKPLGERRGNRHVEVEFALHVARIFFLIALQQRDDDAGGAGSRSSTRTVDVRRVVFRRVEVNYAADFVDVNTARRDIGGDERFGLVRGKCLERSGALTLASPAVNGNRINAEFSELASNAIGAVTSAAEHDRGTERTNRKPRLGFRE